MSTAYPAIAPLASTSSGTVARLRIAAISAVALLMYWHVVAAMVLDWWSDEGSSYGFLIPPVVAYVVWGRRNRLAAESIETDCRGLLVTGFACLTYVIGQLAVESFLTRASLVLLITGLIWTSWGWGRLRILAFPLILLASMIPLPTVVYYQATAPLQLYSSTLATNVARLLGLTIYQDGNIIYLPAISLGVAEACSGLHSALSLSITALLLGYVQCRKLVGRIALVAIAIPIAIFFNVIRIAGTAILADARPEFATGFYHAFSGWLVYVAGSAVLFGASRLVCCILEKRTTS